MTERGLNLIKKYEGFSPVVYICPAGYPTIGYGHVVLPGEVFSGRITREEAKEILKKDVLKVEKTIKSMLPGVRLHEYCYDALVSFAYNCGIYAFRASTLRKKILRKEYIEASHEFLRWVYAGGRKLKGLERRRKEEQSLYLEGLKLYNLL